MNRNNCHFLLQRCRNIEQLKQTHAQAITQGFHHLQHLACKILNSYTKFNKPIEAYNVFNQIQNPDIISWTSLISLYLYIDRPFEALSVFSKLTFLGLKPDSFSVVGALSACGRSENLGHGKTVHGMIYRHELGSDSIVGNALIDMYSRNGEIKVAQLVFREMDVKDVVTWTSLIHGFIKCNNLNSARKLFDKMSQRNSISWTAMITGYIQGGKPIQALEIFQKMKSEGNDIPTAITIVAVLSGCADIGALDLGQSIHGYIIKTYLNLDVTTKNALMDMYLKSGSLENAEKAFEEILRKDKFSWTTMILGFAVHGNGNRAIQIFSEMLDSGESPNEVTFVAVLSACSHAGLVDEGQRWFKRMRETYVLEPKIEHYGCMVDLLGRSGLVEEAKDLIEKMQVEPDAVIWRSLLSSCLVCGNLELAKMAGEKIIELEPDDDGVYVLLWNMYCSENRWEEALKMRKMMRDRRIKKKPGCSWIEVNSVVHEFLAEDKMHSSREQIYSVLERIAEQMKIDPCLFEFEFD
ncbi:Pentatricopeptide repeat [Macleaya cordata]|uniref:Pentatricopeptide repeat n=1 Tax=Macleaya cordata TaxID=56857 RepID=A0A200Q532_MACCD|nr:Pentatricopeptide repeat [Macleaya cordata]